MKNFDTYIREELQIGKIKHDIYKHKYQTGDVCIYKSDDNKSDGKKCLITDKFYEYGDSFFQKVSDYFRTDYCPRINFAKSKRNYYEVEFLDYYDDYASFTMGKPDTLKRTLTLKKWKVPEEKLEFDPISTKKYRDEQEELRKAIGVNDPYGEDDWISDEDKKIKYKYDHNKEEWIDVKENINQDIDPYGEEDWDERGDIFINEDEMGQIFLNITKNHVELESFLDNQVHDYIVNYITNRLEDIDEKDFEEATQDTPFPFIVIDENDPWKHSKGYFVLINGVLKIVQWGPK